MTTPYLLLPLSLLLILFYLICLILVKAGIIRQNYHRKIWNTLLLITFLITAVLGLLLAVQINYKLEWNSVRTILKWHVNFGIAMSFIAIFHFIWHWHYYFNILKPDVKSHSEDTSNIPDNPEPQKIYALMITSGLISIAIQVLLVREINTLFEGNELMMGWTLGIWMFLTGMGAYLGSQIRLNSPTQGTINNFLILICTLPIIIVVVINLIKTELFPPGVLINPLSFLLIVLLILLPICLLVGFAFSVFVHAFKTDNHGFVKVYALESLGSLVGGILVSFLFIQWFSILESLVIILLITLICIYIINRERRYLFSLLFVSGIVLMVFVLPIDNVIRKKLFPNQNLLENKETRYGNLTVTETFGQYNFFINGSFLFATGNVISNEENVHYAMLQHGLPRNVLLISGGVSGMIDEVLKYPTVKSIDYVEVNPELIRLASKYKLLPTNGKVNIYIEDGRRFVKRIEKHYDVVIFSVPDPVSLQVNRYYTREFLQEVKTCLTPGAVVTFGLSPAGNYISPEKANIIALVYHTLKSTFRNVEVIPGEKDYFIASDSLINNSIAELSVLRGIANKFVNQNYIDDFSTRQRGNFIKENIQNKRIINTDNKPLPVFYESLHFISLFGEKSIFMLLIPLAVFAIPLFFFRSASKGIYIAGFAASSAEMLLIFSFQLVYGYVYSAIGLIIALFMGGLVLGSLLGSLTNPGTKNMIIAQASLGLFFLLYPLLEGVISQSAGSFLIYTMFILMTIVPSAIVGYIYVMGTKQMRGDIIISSSVNYSADLIGSALGVISITVIMIPLLGITKSCFLIAGIIFGGMILTLLTSGVIFKRWFLR